MGKKGRGKKGKTRRNNEISKMEEPEELRRAAHSFVVSRGRTGRYVSQLVLNFRRILEPFTASQLNSRGTTVRDLAAVAGPLGVTHLCVFTRTQIATYLKLAKLPRGPSLTFRVCDYTLTRDVLHSLRRRVTYSRQFLHGALLVLNNFAAGGRHVQLAATMLQNMFPVLNIHKVKLNSLRRAVLFSYNASDETIDMRHYTIKLVPVGVSRGVKKLVTRAHVPNLGRLHDLSEFVMRPGYGSESEAEDDPTSHVQLAQEVRSRGNMVNTQSAIRLVELGPRLTLKLMKAEAGLLDGEVLYHSLVTKTAEQLEAIRARREHREQLKARRRSEQEKNVSRKAELRERQRQRSLDGMKKALEDAAARTHSDEDDEDAGEDGGDDDDGNDDDGNDDEAGPVSHDDGGEVSAKAERQPAQDDSENGADEDDGENDDGDDDVEWYRREVGQEPDQEFRAVAAAASGGGGGASMALKRRFAKKRPAAASREAPPAEKRQRGGAHSRRATPGGARARRAAPVSGFKVRRRQTDGGGRGGRGRS